MSSIAYGVGCTVDVVGSSRRTINAQDQIYDRLVKLPRRFVDEANIEPDLESIQYNGDGFHFFPKCDVPTAVHHFLFTFPALLADDNLNHAEDRLRLRMAIAIGTVGRSPVGLVGDAVTTLSRLVECQGIRDAVDMYGHADVVAVVSDAVYNDVIVRFDDFRELPFQDIDVEVKTYRARAHLLIPRPPEQQ
jgi:hypothetical protein